MLKRDRGAMLFQMAIIMIVMIAIMICHHDYWEYKGATFNFNGRGGAQGSMDNSHQIMHFLL